MRGGRECDEGRDGCVMRGGRECDEGRETV